LPRISDILLRRSEPPLWAKRFTLHCNKNSDLSRRQTTMKSVADLPVRP
jgi:hypothetical protein